jgi:hypothetical protein
MQDRLKDPSGKRPVRETEPDEVDLAIAVRYERETLPSGEEVVHLNDGIHVLLEVGGFELGLQRRSRNESVATTPRAATPASAKLTSSTSPRRDVEGSSDKLQASWT